MSKNDILAELPKLRPEDRLEILDRICELDSQDWLDGGELNAEEKSMLEARLKSYQDSPEAGSSWEEVESRIREKLGK